MVIYTVVCTCTVRPGQCKLHILLKSKSTSVNEGIQNAWQETSDHSESFSARVTYEIRSGLARSDCRNEKEKKSHYSALQKQPGHYSLLTWCYFCKNAQINDPLYIYNTALTTARIINFGIHALSLKKATEYLLGKSQSKLLQDVSRAQSFSCPPSSIFKLLLQRPR